MAESDFRNLYIEYFLRTCLISVWKNISVVAVGEFKPKNYGFLGKILKFYFSILLQVLKQRLLNPEATYFGQFLFEIEGAFDEFIGFGIIDTGIKELNDCFHVVFVRRHSRVRSIQKIVASICHTETRLVKL